jgi:oxygen-independent coproporphyrinogen III oxidase
VTTPGDNSHRPPQSGSTPLGTQAKLTIGKTSAKPADDQWGQQAHMEEAPAGKSDTHAGTALLPLGPIEAFSQTHTARGIPRSLYIHMPFCVHKCHYCDFFSFVDTKDQQQAFTTRLIRELKSLAPYTRGLPLKTIFIGGGTPSMLKLDCWEEVLGVLNDHYDLSLIRAQVADDVGLAEFTVECNPESTTPELLGLLRQGGVNRVSIGAQSFNQQHLLTLQRLHDPQRVPIALDLARQAGIPRSSIDLIYAIPGQTLDQWHSDLQHALALGTTHLSCYNLTYEPNTQMTVRKNRGEFTPVDEDLEADMFALTQELLQAKGLSRYEVSNYAKSGLQSRHNLAYWLQEPWLAAGPSSSGHAYVSDDWHQGSHRYKHAGNMSQYLGAIEDDVPFLAPLSDHEPPDPARLLRERLMTGLRLTQGLHWQDILHHANVAAPQSIPKLEETLRHNTADGLMQTTQENRITLTDKGWLLADHLARTMMNAVGEKRGASH